MLTQSRHSRYHRLVDVSPSLCDNASRLFWKTRWIRPRHSWSTTLNSSHTWVETQQHSRSLETIIHLQGRLLSNFMLRISKLSHSAMEWAAPQFCVETFQLHSEASRLWLCAACDHHYTARLTLLTFTRTKGQHTLRLALRLNVGQSFGWSRSYTSQALPLLPQYLNTATLQALLNVVPIISVRMSLSLHLTSYLHSAYTSDYCIIIRSSLRVSKLSVELPFPHICVRLLSTPDPGLCYFSTLPLLRSFWLGCYRYAIMLCSRIRGGIHN